MGPANPLPSASFLMAEGVIGFNGKLDTVGDVVVGAGVLGSGAGRLPIVRDPPGVSRPRTELYRRYLIDQPTKILWFGREFAT